MAETVWNLVNPVGTTQLKARETTLRQLETGSLVVGFMSNRKTNASALLRALASRLEVKQLRIKFYEKASAAVGAGEELLDRVSGECGLVINGVGD